MSTGVLRERSVNWQLTIQVWDRTLYEGSQSGMDFLQVGLSLSFSLSRSGMPRTVARVNNLASTKGPRALSRLCIDKPVSP